MPKMVNKRRKTSTNCSPTTQELCGTGGCKKLPTKYSPFHVYNSNGFSGYQSVKVCDTCSAVYEHYATENSLPGYYTLGFIGQIPPPPMESTSSSLVPSSSAAAQLEVDNWPEFQNALTKMTIRMENGSNSKISETIVDASFLLVDSFNISTQPELIEFPIGNSTMCFFNLSCLTMSGVTYRTWQLALILQKTKRLKSLSIINVRWEYEQSINPGLLTQIPRIPTLKYLQVRNHQGKCSSIASMSQHYFWRIFNSLAKGLQFLKMDGQVCFHTPAENNPQFYRNLRELEVFQLNIKDFGKSPPTSAPLQRLVVHRIHDEDRQTTSMQQVWQFVEKFSATICDIRLQTGTFWNSNSKDYDPKVSFPHLTSIELPLSKNVQDFAFLGEKLLPKLPALKQLYLQEDDFHTLEVTEIRKFKRIIRNMPTKQEALKVFLNMEQVL